MRRGIDNFADIPQVADQTKLFGENKPTVAAQQAILWVHRHNFNQDVSLLKGAVNSLPIATPFRVRFRPLLND